MRTLVLTLLALLLVAPRPLTGQEAAADTTARQQLRVFLDCQTGGCNFDYIRTEIPFVSWVRDRTVANVHVLVTSARTAAGGRQYQMAFLRPGRGNGAQHTLSASLSPTATQNEQRERFVQTLSLGLVPFLLDSPLAGRLRVGYDAMDDRPLPAEIAAGRDPWDRWVFELGVAGDVEGESSFAESDVDLSLSAERVTDDWKFELDVFASHDRRDFELQNRRVETQRHTYQATSLLAKSLSPHLSAGATVSTRSATYGNTDFVVRLAPAVEYNVFPYAEATRRQFTIRYSAGINSLNYAEETVFGVTEETVWSHALQAGLELNQPWGQANLSLTGSQFLDHRNLYRLSGWGGVRLRLFRGLSLRANASYAKIQNQISLPAGNLSEEEILLRIRERRTGYRYSTSIGLSYTFGSIYNNVVNPRFERPRYFD